MNNKFPQIHLIYDRCHRATPHKQGAVEIRITHNYKQKYLATGIMLYPNQWKNGKIVNCSNIIQISQILEKQLADIRQTIIDMMNDGNIDITTIFNKPKKEDMKRLTFIQFCEQRAAIRKYGKEKDTQERYDRFLRKFKKWGKIVRFEDINENAIIDYDKYLIAQGMKPYSKWNNYLRFLNSFILDAIDEGYILRNPYKWVNIDKGNSDKGIDKYLSFDEFKRIKKVNMPTESLTRVRDLFIFQTYTCLRYSDLKLFDTKFVKDIKGMKVYIRASKKTKKPFTVPILPYAWDILMKYDGKLPIISNSKYNQYLKVVAQAAGIDKPISCHWARHTGSTHLINEGVDINIIRKICGHSSTKITEQIYAKILDETVVDAIQNIKL